MQLLQKTNGLCFPDTVNYLDEHFKDDDSKEHYFVDDAVTSKERKKKGNIR